MLDFSGESKKNKRFFIFFVKKEPFLSAPKGMGFPGLKFIMKNGESYDIEGGVLALKRAVDEEKKEKKISKNGGKEN